MSGGDDSIYGTIIDVVNGGYSTFQTYANQSFDLAAQSINRLRNAEFTFTPVAINFDVQGGPGDFEEPTRPTRQISSFVRPSAPGEFEPARVVISDAGPAPGEPENLGVNYQVPGGEPGNFTERPPAELGALPEVIFPDDENDYTMPALPTLLELDIKAAPTITLPTFGGVRPEVDFAVPVSTFTFTERPYESTMVDALREKLAALLDGESGIEIIEQQLYDRARSKEETAAIAARSEVMADFASRGFPEPPGLLAKRLLQVTQGSQNQSATFNREVMIQSHTVKVENLRFAIGQTIAHEQIFVQAHLTAEERRFQAAKFLFDGVLNIFNARVVLHNSLVEAYKADAAIFREEIAAEIAKAELYKTEIDAQKIIGEINTSLIEQYIATVRGILGRVEIFRARTDAATARVQGNVATIEGQRARVQAFAESVRAYGIQWEAYDTRVRAKLGTVTAAEVMARIYATKVQAWSTKNQVNAEQARVELGREEIGLRAYETNIRRFAAEIDGQRAQLGAEAQALSAEAQVYSAHGLVSQSRSAARDRAFQLAIERGRAQADIALQNGSINLQASLQAQGYYLEAERTISSSATQLAGSSLSAINISGGVSGSVGFSSSTNRGLSKSWGWSGETEDNNSPPSYT